MAKPSKAELGKAVKYLRNCPDEYIEGVVEECFLGRAEALKDSGRRAQLEFLLEEFGSLREICKQLDMDDDELPA